MNEDIDIGAELYDKIHADFLKQLGEARELRSMADVSGYSGQVGRALSRAIATNLSPDVLPDGRLYYNIARSILEPSLRENHELVNSAAEQVQRELDEWEGIRIKPMRPEFPTERVNDVISAASAEGIPWEKTLRRVTSPAETITMSFADDFMKANAEKRSRAGFDTFIDRQGGGKCCLWCAKLIGHFKYPDNVPKDVYRRHDNCTCTVTYGTKGGARQDVWSKVTWTVPPAKELHRGAVQGAEKAPHRLTGGANGGIINEKSNKPVIAITDNAIQNVQYISVHGYTEEQSKIIQQQHKELLKIARDKNDNFEVAIVLNRELEPSAPLFGRDNDVTFGMLNGTNLTILHNHPRGSSFSANDLEFFCKCGQVKTLTIVKNNGQVEYITKANSFNPNTLSLEYARLHKKMIKKGTNDEYDKLIKKLLTVTKSGVIWNE